MSGDAIEYPARGKDALTTILVGGLLPILAGLIGLVGLALSVVLVGLVILPFALVPMLALFGYYIAVLRRVTAGDPDPPRFRNWKRLLVDGIRFLVVSIAYAVPLLVLSGLFAAVIAVSETMVGDPTAETIAAVGAAVSALLAVGYLLVYAYVQPLALANLARENSLRAAFDLPTLRNAGISKAYAVAWLLAALVWFVGRTIESSLWIVLVGFFIGFYANVVRYYLYGRGLHEALSESTTESESVTTSSSEPTDLFVPATERLADPLEEGTIPRIEEPAAFEARSRTLDRERGWPDWETAER